MAPEQETELARIIRSIECQPVLWKKHEVWSAVQERVAPKKKRFRLFRYAAALIAFMCIKVDTLRESPFISVTVPAHDHAITPIIDESEQKVFSEKSAETITKNRKDRHQGLRPKTASVEVVRPANAINRKQHDEVNTEDDKAPEGVAMEPIETGHLSAASQDAVAEPRIKAIVGVVGWSDGNNTETRKKHRQLFQRPDPPETVYKERTAPSMVIARLK